MPFDDRYDLLEKEFVATLAALRDLYTSAAREMVERYPQQLGTGVGDFPTSMDDLHKGLALKACLALIEADLRWTAPEKRFSELLFQHVWGEPVSGPALKDTAVEVMENLRSVTWFQLVKPFADLKPLRARVGELETIVMRMANLVAKCDGTVSPGEEALLRSLQNEIDVHFRPLPLESRDEGRRSREATEDLPERSRSARETSELWNLVRERVAAGDVAKDERRVDSEPPPKKSGKKKADEEEEEDDPLAKSRPKADPNVKPPTLEECLKELEGLIGLSGIKKEIRTLVNYLDLQRKRAEAGLPKVDITLHMCFNGNPGTGKTTVARIVGKLFQAMGILAKGHLLETDRSGLVAKYAGQTGPRTHKKVDEALDGILFIDEAYTLSMQSSEDVFGQEALQALVKRMEDDRARLAVIMAGYSGPMQKMLQVNPGLTSRIANQFEFPDYTPEELGRIFGSMCAKNQYQLPAASRIKALRGFRQLYEDRDEHFGNGRAARNVFEDSIRKLANRVAGVAPVTKELLTTLEPDDIEFDKLDDAWFAEQEREPLRVRVTCATCGKPSTAPGEYLGRQVSCKKCKAKFTLDWGEPLVGEVTTKVEESSEDEDESPTEPALGDESPEGPIGLS